MEWLLADSLFIDGALQEGPAVALTPEGTIGGVGTPPEGARVTRLRNRVLVPGFVNAHSHSFQRASRGRIEFRQDGQAQDDFWTWRTQMYAAAEALEPADVEALACACFVEMALAGITTVGEFHYLHHAPGGESYADPDELAWRIVEAARRAGLNLVLLRVSYARGGFRRPAEPRQARFVDPAPDTALRAIERLQRKGVRVGVAPHSVRACPRDWLVTLGAYANQRMLPLHLHVSEQPREVQECKDEHGRTPLSFLATLGLVSDRFTGIHGVHLTQEEWLIAGRCGATIAACPTTARNLGDGIVPARALLDAGAFLAIGTDSQAQIAPLEDVRQLEYHLRLQSLTRAVIGRDGGEPGASGPAARLLEIATAGGARSLRESTGRILKGLRADLVAFDLHDPSLAGAVGDATLAGIVFGAERTAVTDVWAKGRRIVEDRRHAGWDAARTGLQAVQQRLWGG